MQEFDLFPPSLQTWYLMIGTQMLCFVISRANLNSWQKFLSQLKKGSNGIIYAHRNIQQVTMRKQKRSASHFDSHYSHDTDSPASIATSASSDSLSLLLSSSFSSLSATTREQQQACASATHRCRRARSASNVGDVSDSIVVRRDMVSVSNDSWIGKKCLCGVWNWVLLLWTLSWFNHPAPGYCGVYYLEFFFYIKIRS